MGGAHIWQLDNAASGPRFLSAMNFGQGSIWAVEPLMIMISRKFVVKNGGKGIY